MRMPRYLNVHAPITMIIVFLRRRDFALQKVMKKRLILSFPLITLGPRSVSFYLFNNQYIIN